MVNIQNILTTNLRILEQQEKELTNTLNLVRQIKGLISGNIQPDMMDTAKKRGRPRLNKDNGISFTPALTAKRGRGRPRKTTTNGVAPSSYPAAKVGAVPAGMKLRKGSWIEQIVKTISSRGPLESGAIIEHIFNKQKKIKDIKEMRKLVYPVFSRAYRDNILVKRGGIVNLAKK